MGRGWLATFLSVGQWNEGGSDWRKVDQVKKAEEEKEWGIHTQVNDRPGCSRVRVDSKVKNGRYEWMLRGQEEGAFI